MSAIQPVLHPSPSRDRFGVLTSPRASVVRRRAEADHLLDFSHAPRPVAVSAKGLWITDAAGQTYLDAVGGVHVVSIGHGVREIAASIGRQAGELSFASTRYFSSSPQLELAQLIGTMTPAGLNRCFFASGGSEAVELAIQIAYHWQKLRGKPKRTKVIGQQRSFHGGTLAAVSLGGHPGHRDRLAPFLIPFLHAPATPAYGADPTSFAQALDALITEEGPESVCAFIAEPISGTTSGAIVPPSGWHEAIRAVCDRHDVLFIADEVTTGFGRTGKNFAVDHWSAVPDILIGAKGLTSGYAPLAVIVAHDKIADAVQRAPERLPVRITFAGNPLACAAGLAVQNYIEEHGLIARCRLIGDHLQSLLCELSDAYPQVGIPRGMGLLRALPLWQDATRRIPFPRSERVHERLTAAALRHGLVVMGGSGSDGSSDGDHLLLSPPFIISEAECSELIGRLAATLDEVLPGLA